MSSDPNISGLMEKIEVLHPLLNPKTFATFFKKMDLNQDGMVDFQEFNSALNHALDTATITS